MFKIGNIIIKNNIVLAPMAGICNSAFRRIIKEMGVGLIYAEMVSDKSLIYNNKKALDMLYVTDEERPIAQQIFGSDVESFVEAAKIVYEKMHPDIIDINMGCPVPKVALRSQAGASLLKDVDKVYEIVWAIVQAVPIPVTVKIRSGWDKNSINAPLIAKICEKAGAKAITIHGRTRSEGYSGHVSLDIIKEVKEAVNIPVIGNGDILTLEDAKKMFEYTKCDAVMVGRGVLGNPWLIRDLVDYFDQGIVHEKVSYKERILMCIKHFKYLLELKSEKVAVLEMRSHIAWYVKGLDHANEFKKEVFKVTNAVDLFDLLNNYLNYLENYYRIG